MAGSLPGRIIGVETEFGTLVSDETLGTPTEVVEQIKNHVFYEMRLGALDLHSRDEVFEPARSGGFMLNGSRFYIDAVGSHLEYATAECRSIKDVIANDRAGQRLIVRAIRELGWQDRVSVYNNSIDHFGGHTFGCHENYLARIDEEFFSAKVPFLYGFLVTRQIFAGVGRVGGHVLIADGHRPSYDDVMANPVDYIWVSQIYGVIEDDSVRFQLSQRADHILKTVASRVRFNRALINPKWEHFYSHEQLQRLHLLFGESNQNEYAYALKIGTTSLAIRLVEDGLVDEHLVPLRPLIALREVSRDESFEWPVLMVDGSTIRATELQRRYLERAEIYRGEDDQTDWILDQWSFILNELERDPLSLGRHLDWVAKRDIVDQYRVSESLEWGDGSLHSIDLEYHNIDPDASLFHAIQQDGGTERILREIDIVDASTRPPKDTRALGRSQLIRKILEKKGRKYYVIDWNCVVADHREIYDLSDPFDTYDGVSEDSQAPNASSEHGSE